MNEKPIVEIFREESLKYRVRIDGKEVEHLRSFSVSVSNARSSGVQEAPFYQVEQYFPALPLQRAKDELGGNLGDDGKRGVDGGP